MPTAVIARQQGDEYQALFFWLQACRLFQSHTKATRVVWEMSSAIGFDDVVVHYDSGFLDPTTGENILTEYYQVKFHVDHQRSFTHDALIDPSFIGAKTESLLQRLHRHHKLGITNARFLVVNTWGVDSNDPIGQLLGSEGQIRLHILFDNTGDGSKFGKVRKQWRDHLGIHDDELLTVLSPLRIRHNFDGLEQIIERLNDKLQISGLSPIEADKRTAPYISLIQRLHAQGRNEFTKADLNAVFQQEGLLIKVEETEDNAFTIGVRSFLKGAERLDDEVQSLLCLLPHFNGRHINEVSAWKEVVYPSLCTFLDDALAQGKPITVQLDTHLSLAFSVGYCLDPKHGVSVTVIQKTRRGKLIWRPDDQHDENFDGLWNWQEYILHDSATDLALAVGVTHQLEQDVLTYISEALPTVGRLLVATVSPEPSNTVVKDGTHALKLAQSLTFQLRRSRSTLERRGRLHLFLASPNAIALFIGQQARSLGPITLYEYDFDLGGLGAYVPTLSFPIC